MYNTFWNLKILTWSNSSVEVGQMILGIHFFIFCPRKPSSVQWKSDNAVSSAAMIEPDSSVNKCETIRWTGSITATYKLPPSQSSVLVNQQDTAIFEPSLHWSSIYIYKIINYKSCDGNINVILPLCHWKPQFLPFHWRSYQQGQVVIFLLWQGL